VADLVFGRIWLGLALGLGFGLVVNLAVANTWVRWEASPGAAIVCWAVAAAAWIANAVWVVKRYVLTDPADAQERTDQLFREAQGLQLKGEFAKAIAALERLLGLAGADCDAMVYLAGLYEREGRPREAVRLWRRCRVHDWPDKWKYETEEALERLSSRS
jgi:tetratricopeptide (TPR) repeat protein